MIKITYYESLRNYGYREEDARVRDLFTCEELEQLESVLESTYPDGLCEYDIENLFDDEGQYACELLGIDYENDFLKREVEF